MKVNGYQLAEKIKQTKSDVELFTEQFHDNLTYFESDGESAPDLTKVMAELESAHVRLATLKAAQTRYNNSIRTSYVVDGRKANLFEAFSLLGVYGKIEAQWKTAAKQKVGTSRLYGGDTRSKDQEYAKKSVPADVATKNARAAGSVVAQLKAAINAANLIEVDTADIDLPVSFD